ncbi:hypothetical protein JXQ70_17360 [bacterium]|nr:hypothetical protein [bacterium]
MKWSKHVNSSYHPEKVNAIGIGIAIVIGDKNMAFGHEQRAVDIVSVLYVK